MNVTNFVLHDHHALGTRWWVEVFDVFEEDKVLTLKNDVLDLISTFENTYSRFKQDSLLTKLNVERSLPNPPGDLLAMLSLSFLIYDRSGGVFDPRVGSILEKTGYGVRVNELTCSLVNGLDKAGKLTLSEAVTANTQIVELLDDSTIDLAGVGKGFLIGKIKSLLLKHGVQHFLINGGGDIYATSDHGKAITVELQHPFQLDTLFAQVALLNQCVCVSSPALRSWKDDKTGKIFSHIVHPLVSDADVTGSVVVGTDPALCDGLATTFCLLPEAECARLAKELGVSFQKIIRPAQ